MSVLLPQVRIQVSREIFARSAFPSAYEACHASDVGLLRSHRRAFSTRQLRSHALRSPSPQSECKSLLRSRNTSCPSVRHPLHTSGTARAGSTNAASSSSDKEGNNDEAGPKYAGPLVNTFARLKLFSLGSLFLATGMTPVLLLAPGEIGMAGRIGLCATALATSGVSTAIIAWIGGPYVGRMKLLQDQRPPALSIETLSWRLRPIRTTIHQPAFIRGTTRPFATWELASALPASSLSSGADSTTEAQEKLLVADSVDVRSGKVLGKWWANATPGSGNYVCSSEGKPVRYFNVHDELLGEDWQIL